MTCISQTWQRPTLPRLETKYHQRWSVSRPSSEWDRVQPLRHDHQVSERHVVREAGYERLASRDWRIACLAALFATHHSLLAVCFVPRIAVSRWAWVMRTIKSIELLVPVSFTHCCASTPGLSTWSSSTALIGNTRFEVGFPLRCLQRLSRPYIATLLCGWRHNRSTRDPSIPVLSY